jgi:hypothetical protein
MSNYLFVENPSRYSVDSGNYSYHFNPVGEIVDAIRKGSGWGGILSVKLILENGDAVLLSVCAGILSLHKPVTT